MNEQNADWLCRRIEKESHFFEERRSTTPKGTRFVEIEVSSRDAGGTRCLSADSWEYLEALQTHDQPCLLTGEALVRLSSGDAYRLQEIAVRSINSDGPIFVQASAESELGMLMFLLLPAVHGEDRDAVVERIDDARFWSR